MGQYIITNDVVFSMGVINMMMKVETTNGASLCP